MCSEFEKAATISQFSKTFEFWTARLFHSQFSDFAGLLTGTCQKAIVQTGFLHPGQETSIMKEKPMVRLFRMSLLLTLLLWSLTSTVHAQSKADFLGVEGGPAKVGRALDTSIRTALMKQKGFKLLPANTSNLSMTRLVLGCVGDTPACMKRIASTRGAKILFHAKLAKSGGSYKATFRRIDGGTGKASKTVTQTFTSSAASTAGAALVNKMFGVKPAPRPTPVARRKPPARRDDGGWPVVAIRRTPPVRPIARPRPRVVEPIRRKVPVVARRVAPKPRKRVVARRPAPRPRKRVVIARPRPAQPTAKGGPRILAWVAAGVAVAAAGGVVAAGLNAQSKGAQIDDLIQKSNEDYDVNYRRNVEPLENQGRNSALLANVLIGVAAAAAATSVVLFVLPNKRKPAMRKSTKVAASKGSTVTGKPAPKAVVPQTRISF